jgi:hypothetical protein
VAASAGTHTPPKGPRRRLLLPPLLLLPLLLLLAVARQKRLLLLLLLLLLLCAVAARCRNMDGAAANDRPSAERIRNIILMVLLFIWVVCVWCL